MGQTPLTIEYVFGGAMSFLMALLWYYIRALAERFKEAETARQSLRERLHAVEINYRTKADATADTQTVMAALGRLESKIDRMGEKIDRKADKS